MRIIAPSSSTVVLIIAAVVVAQVGSGPARAAASQTAASPMLSEPVNPRATFDRYCVSCHNQRQKTAGLLLDAVDVSKVGGSAEIWEKILRKLRAGTMPPSGPRPPKTTYDGISVWIEQELDRAAAAHPNPGRVAVHRLNRTEYQNAIRDLLSLDIDASSLLPGDDAAFGFDNVADLLKVSPDLLDSYLTAANKVSRLAVGDTALSLGSHTYDVPLATSQTDRAGDALSFGSRGGTAVRHYFPADGEYTFKVYVNGFPKPPADVEPVDVWLDGSLVASLNSAGRNSDSGIDQGAVRMRLAVKAGPRTVGVSLRREHGESERRYPTFFPWANSTIFNTSTGAANYMKIKSLEIAGPFSPADFGDTPSRRRVFSCTPASDASADPCARKILTALSRRAFRRPVAAPEIEPLVDQYRTGKRLGASFVAGIQMALERLLVDPSFLFRVQQVPVDTAPGVPYRISDVDLASRLSFFLWSSIPDEELLDASERGRLRDPAVLEQQVRRMLADPRAETMVTNFATQWLYLRNVKALTPDTFQFPDWDEDLRAAMSRETELFLASQFREDRSITELLTANYTFVNERLAKHYGMPGVYGARFRRVALPDGRRAGLLGHASILAVTSYANRTSPVLRGKWILENLLGTPPPPPPPDVPDLPPPSRDQPKTMREQMEKHRTNPICSGCHSNMDPFGFALENFDAIGTWRTHSAGQVVDTRSVLPDGTRVDGPDGVRTLVQARRAQYIETVTEKLMTYAIGRGVEYYDMPAIRRIVRDAAARDFRWSSLILGITRSVPFQMSVRRES